MAKDNRPLSARIDAYIANLESVNAQVTNLIGHIQQEHPKADTNALAGMIELQSHIIEDLTKIVNGEQLEPFELVISI